MDEKTRQRCLGAVFFPPRPSAAPDSVLAMVYGMMQRHDGTIEIESSPGPIKAPVPGSLSRSRKNLRNPSGALCRKSNQSAPFTSSVLMTTRRSGKLLDDCLTHFNHRVMVASGGEHGMELFRTAMQKNQPYEVVITDLGMPKMDGHQVARTIKAESPNTPIIMMTGGAR